jgi:cytidine deaminase
MKIAKSDVDQLIAVALKARKAAHAALTGYKVGASVMGNTGRIYPGCNVEFPTGILHTCAERAAIVNAVSHGEKRILAVCTVSEGSFPCGVCRQAIQEFGDGKTPIYSLMRGKTPGKWRVASTTIAKLLPGAHTGETIERYRS